jgi:hypothetical protein
MPQFNSMKVNGRLAYLCLIVCGLFSASAFAQQSGPAAFVRISARSQSDKAVEGVQAQLILRGTVIGSTTTNEKGEAEFVNIAPGSYEIVVTQEGFEPLTQRDIVVAAGAPLEIRFTLSPKIALSETVTIHDRADSTIEKESSPATDLQRKQVKEAPNRPATVADTLPLVPGVVRSAEGEIKISGSGEHRSALIVNSADVTDRPRDNLA